MALENVLPVIKALHVYGGMDPDRELAHRRDLPVHRYTTSTDLSVSLCGLLLALYDIDIRTFGRQPAVPLSTPGLPMPTLGALPSITLTTTTLPMYHTWQQQWLDWCDSYEAVILLMKGFRSAAQPSVVPVAVPSRLSPSLALLDCIN